jgi:hypothetical protein
MEDKRNFSLFLFIAAVVFAFFVWIMPLVGTANSWMLFAVFMVLSSVIYLIVHYIAGDIKKC